MTRLGTALLLLLLIAPVTNSQGSQPRPKRDTWYEQALRRINPENTDFGGMWEQRKHQFLSQLGNRHFQYSLAATMAAILLLPVTIAQRISHKRSLDLAAQSIADVLRHDEYSRQAAREAIRRYNDHIESCNRLIESSQAGLSKSISATEAELQRVKEELADTREENRTLRNQFAKNPQISAGVPVRQLLQHEQSIQREMDFVPAQYVARINALEKELRAEKRKNQQAKGTSVNDHRA